MNQQRKCKSLEILRIIPITNKGQQCLLTLNCPQMKWIQPLLSRINPLKRPTGEGKNFKGKLFGSFKITCKFSVWPFYNVALLNSSIKLLVQ